jgi:hypothetical protein
VQPSGAVGDALGSAALLGRIFESICRPLKVRFSFGCRLRV